LKGDYLYEMGYDAGKKRGKLNRKEKSRRLTEVKPKLPNKITKKKNSPSKREYQGDPEIYGQNCGFKDGSSFANVSTLPKRGDQLKSEGAD